MIEPTLREDLRATSRAFYLSLVFLPRAVRPAIALAYALARAADTIADTTIVPPERRLDHLDRLLAAVGGDSPAALEASVTVDLAGAQGDPGERRLLGNLARHLGLLAALDPTDRGLVEEVLRVLVGGMKLDLCRFERPAALDDRAELRDYCFRVAGVVGEFWTAVHAAHLTDYARYPAAAMKASGVRFGNGLQLTNILRDLPRDLAIGRCYLPREDLARHGLAPAELALPGSGGRLRPLFLELIGMAVEDYSHGFAYTLSVRRRHLRSRLCCALPLLIGIETLGLLALRTDPLDPTVTIKIGRGRVRRLLGRALLAVGSDRALETAFRRTLRSAGFEAAAESPFPTPGEEAR